MVLIDFRLKKEFSLFPIEFDNFQRTKEMFVLRIDQYIQEWKTRRINGTTLVKNDE